MVRREFRFYICLALGFVLFEQGLQSPPPGEISRSVILAAALLLCIGALAVGLDIVGVLEKIKELIVELQKCPSKKEKVDAGKPEQ